MPSYEKPCYEAFQLIHKQILEVKNNRNKYINSKQVYQIYYEFLSQLHELSVTRKDEELKGIKLQIPNSNDVKIDDIWQLLSLCFVTCGLIKFAPATYSSLSTVHKLLDHLQECQVYTLDDLKPIRVRLDEIRQIITQSEEKQEEDDDDEGDTAYVYHVEERMLLRNKLNKCYQLYNQLEANFKNIPPDLEVTYNDLILLRKLLLNYFTLEESASGTSQSRPKVATIQSLNELKHKLKEINAKRDPDDGRFISQVATPDELESIQVVLNGLFDDCQNLIQDLYIRDNNDDVTDLFQAMSLKDASIQDEKYKSFLENSYKLYQQLIDLKSKLENLMVTRRWTMRETDLYSFQQSLKSIDQERLQLINDLASLSVTEVGGNELTSNTPSVSPPLIKRIELLLLYLLRRCYSLIYKLLESSEPVSESLQPIHNQLSTVKRCLLDIRRINGLNNLRELYPFQMKLALIDVKRIDGKFEVNGQVPEGQGTLNALLEECYDIVHELKIELEEMEDDDENDDDDDDERSIRIGGLGTPVLQAGPSGLGGSVGNIASNNNSTVNFFRKGELGAQLDFDDIETKRKRFAGFKEADYDSDSFNEDEEDDEDSFSSDEEYESNDYY